MSGPCHILLAATVLVFSASLSSAQELEPWQKARALKDFSSLLGRSPFSLPTAEEKVASEERFHLAGAATMGGEQVVFVWDKNTHQRLLLRAEADGSGNRLVEFFTDPNPKNMRAKVEIAGQTADIRFSDAAFELSQAPQQPSSKGPAPGTAPSPPSPQITPGPPGSETPRRVIRRRVISGEASPNQPGK